MTLATPNWKDWTWIELNDEEQKASQNIKALFNHAVQNVFDPDLPKMELEIGKATSAMHDGSPLSVVDETDIGPYFVFQILMEGDEHMALAYLINMCYPEVAGKASARTVKVDNKTGIVFDRRDSDVPFNGNDLNLMGFKIVNDIVANAKAIKVQK